ncbi:YbjQ family protein [Ferrovibrio sp.]|uniref:YbjQ family protein n=1 Tax=Ferrovibrio sp. TaxID=1917215 RepID=UPI0025B9812D|nr:YbjQ family protein [Ferrovibrio sp.]MBX3452957.1 YbjQ family protein [Ferrovibrio sp.]
MIMTTTDSVEGRRIVGYLGVVSGETVMGTNIFKDFFAGVRDIVGGRTKSYEGVLNDAKQEALQDMAKHAAKLGANAIVGIDLDYEAIGGGGDRTLLMVTANGTAVKLD